MTARRGRLIAVTWLIALGVAGACGESSSTDSNDNVHFLDACLTTCAAGLECICGACTRACESADDCSAVFSGASCVHTADAHPTCDDSAPALVCDVTCVKDSDCAALGEANRCSSGYCRVKSAGSTPGTDGGGGSGAVATADASAGTSSLDASAGTGGLDASAGAGGLDASITTGGANSGGTPSTGGASGAGNGSCVLGSGRLGTCLLGF